MDSTKILKLTSGDEIIANISHADKSKPFVEIENPLKINLYPKMSNNGLEESMALSKWTTPKSRTGHSSTGGVW